MRVLSYNMHKGIGGRDRRYRLDRIIDVIETENPDLVCLQEVDRHVRRSGFDDQPRLLAEYFKSAAVLYQPNVHLRRGAYGNLILSRWPLTSKHQISLRLKAKKPRGAQLAVVQTPEGPLHLVNLHLGLAERERHWQIGHLLGHHLFRESAALPTILVGDYNDWRNTLPRAALGHLGFAHMTAPASRFRSFPAYLPLGSLDKMFVRGTVFVRHVRIIHSWLARRASDHLPLVVDFHLDSALAGP
ncbi:MAG TPA: endonuclease/exonuclease/phosphatase family protein [Pirellulales bacterium]|jgi:endonuclease/exonuclease/phosphatase family metal-dependent hydrolase|nr:endonuclease/exonuclease/phosphatase family protein [Pirellulales bacterium]